jgi:hypothetical protein
LKRAQLTTKEKKLTKKAKEVFIGIYEECKNKNGTFGAKELAYFINSCTFDGC